MENEAIRQRLIHIHEFGLLGWKTLYYFFKMDCTLSSIYNMSQQELIPFFQNNPRKASLFYEHLRNLSIDDKHHVSIHNQPISYVTIFDDIYPPLLKMIYDPPWVLYAIGNVNLLKASKVISVVGTRQPTHMALKNMEHVMNPLVQSGWVIVSGLAVGIDTLAHQVAIRGNGATIAVLGSGFQHIYPKQNLKLANKIASDYLLLSEYPPKERPQKFYFPRRNRIISGLSKGTVVIEAKERSGSLITAHQALEQGREVFAFPGNMLEQQSKGTNRLIQDGAHLVLDAEDIIEVLNNV